MVRGDATRERCGRAVRAMRSLVVVVLATLAMGVAAKGTAGARGAVGRDAERGGGRGRGGVRETRARASGRTVSVGAVGHL